MSNRHYLLATLLAATLTLFAQTEKQPAPCGPVPNPNQLRWQAMEMYAFIHYSLNTYTDQEWGFGNEDPQLFNPSNLDCRQWARVCKQAGMKGIIFTAKHHCGFCMWPSKYTEYSVKNSPWKDGKGDVVRELADACRKEGLEFAVYLSPWDRNHPEYGRKEYVTYFRNQLRELLTNYGDIFEMWFDGANGGDGWYGGANEVRKIDRTTYYEWPETYKMIRQLQPKCLIWNDGSDRGDLRWVGTEAGNVGETNWSLLNHDGEVTWEMLHYGLENGDSWVPGETNTSIRPGWFYHDTENEHVKSLSKLMDTYYKSVGRNSTLLLNFPIAPNGRIHPNDSLRGIAFNQMIQEVFKKDLAEDGKVTFGNGGNLQSSIFNIQWNKPTAFNRFVAEEDIRLGQRVRKFALEALVDGQWQPLKDELVEKGDGLTTIGHRRIICFPTVKATQLRFTILDSKAEPVISKLGVYLAPELTPDIPNSGEKLSSDLHLFFTAPNQMMIDYESEQTIKALRYLPPQETKDGTVTHYTLWASSDWTNWTKLATGEFSNIVNNPIWQTIKFPPTKAKILRFEADRLASGGRMGYGDIEVVTEPLNFSAILPLSAQTLDWGDQGNGTYKNPVLNADYSDPDVIRVGNKYYMVASDFHFIGMQVLESDDMVNWQIISHIYDRFDLPGWDENKHYAGGSWAPSIRWHDGRFYVYFCTPEEGLFMSSAENARGPWTPLHCLKAVPKWEDPCPLWDDDGQAYLGRSQHGAGPIIVHKMSPDGKTLLDEGVTVYTGPVAEGTKWLKRNGWYYLIIPEGGVGTGWQTVLRSKNVYGPYEKRVVLEQGSTNVNGPHQGALVDTPEGEWWFYHFQSTHALGRVVHLQPARWKDDWPLIGVDIDGNGIGEPVAVWTKPHIAIDSKQMLPQASDGFNGSSLGLQWQWCHNPNNDCWSLTERKGWLTIHAQPSPDLKNARNMLTQKSMGYCGEATTLMDCRQIKNGTYAGLLCIGREYRGIGVCTDGIYLEDNGQREVIVGKKPNTVYLRIALNVVTNQNQFFYSLDGKRYHPIGQPFEMHDGNWKGFRIGLYCYGDSGKAQFDNFDYQITR